MNDSFVGVDAAATHGGGDNEQDKERFHVGGVSELRLPEVFVRQCWKIDPQLAEKFRSADAIALMDNGAVTQRNICGLLATALASVCWAAGERHES
jgi:hypothetical protein